MPALPLHEAGKYVAGAYGVFVTLLVIYVLQDRARVTASWARASFELRARRCQAGRR